MYTYALSFCVSFVCLLGTLCTIKFEEDPENTPKYWKGYGLDQNYKTLLAVFKQYQNVWLYRNIAKFRWHNVIVTTSCGNWDGG